MRIFLWQKLLYITFLVSVFFKDFQRKCALTLFCSVQQTAPTHQKEECHHRSCTQWRETLGRALNSLDTHILRLSCHRFSGQLWEKKEQSLSDCLSSPPNTRLCALHTCSSENNQKKYELHRTQLPGRQWLYTNLTSGVCFLLIVFFSKVIATCVTFPQKSLMYSEQQEKGECFLLFCQIKLPLHLCQKSVGYKSDPVGIPHFVSLCPSAQTQQSYLWFH